MRVAGAFIAVLIAGSSLQAQEQDQAPICQAERRGESLITRIEYPDGYKVEGPWRITSDLQAGTMSTVRAVLDHIVEFKPLTSTQQMTALPSAIEMTFRGTSLNALLEEAANVWCITVMKARASLDSPSVKRQGQTNRVAM
jgi:hypothetical protein